MSKKVVTRRRELLDRWRAIQEEDDDCDDHSFDHPKQHHLRHLKETWFSDAFNFLIYLPRENHIWCGSWDLMGPLLETFYNYFKDDRQDSPLKLLWKRICEELQECMQCVFQHHQAKDTYTMEYELSSIGPLLDVLCTLDEARVTNQLKEMNARIATGEYDPVKDNARVICVMYEVLMFPELLDDQSLVSEFQIFIEAIDDSHELTLAGHQQYPGVYALLFLKSRRGRSIGFRLAGSMGKLRTAADLDPLQPLLKKCIVFLETEVLPLNSEKARPRMQLDRITVWLGIKALLVFLEPQAFEEGILERYPSFLSIVLNHICDDSPEFSYAINCLRLLFEMLGCKLWLRAALSPSVMRDTLLGQCFHTRDEKGHKEIFDLFPPFLQSLEALQDGEHEKQRRHFIYFLLHQVTVSSNFSTLMRKKACQIALLIIHRGYRMNPSCPPFECAHMWGPSLVSSLKDSSLYSSLRQPAFDLIQTIIVSDAAALVSSLLYSEMHEGADRGVLGDLKDEEDCEGLVFSSDVEEKDVSCWNEFSVQGQTASREFGWWMCIPMLWFDVLLGVDPAVLPVSFSKAVLWALSRFSMVEPETSTEMALPVGHWLSTRASEISHLFGWKMPSGSNDSGDGKESKNSIKVTTMCIPLIRTFRRLTSQFVTKMEQGELSKQWTWEPRMGESLILLLVDPDDNARQVGRRILEQVSDTQGLLSCLQFLCSCSASTTAVFLGLKHALKLLLVDSVLKRYQSLHHFFFVLCKLLKEGGQSGQITPGLLSNDQSMLKFSSQGGFLHQPLFDPVANNNGGNLSEVDSTYWKKFCCLLSEIAWPYFCKCLVEGKTFIDYKMSQMTCIRLLEILPVVMKWLLQPIHRMPGNSGILAANGFDLKWLHDLMYWGKSSLAVVVRYWKQTMLSLLDLLKELRIDNSTSTIMAIEELLQCEKIPIDELAEQVSSLYICLMNDISEPSNAKRNFKSKSLHTEGLWHKGSSSARKPETFGLEDTDVRLLDSAIGVKTERESVVILSDDDIDVEDSVTDATVSHARSSQILVDGNAVVSHTAEKVSQNCAARNKASATPSLEDFHQSETPDSARLVDLKLEANRNIDEVRPPSLVEDKSLQGTRKERSSVALSKSCFKKSSEENTSSKIVNSVPRHLASSLKKVSDEVVPLKSSDERGIKKVSEKSKMIIKEIVFDAEDDPWEFALKSARNHQSLLTKLNTGGPRRQVIQLSLPVENRVSPLNRVGSLHQRFKPQRLDEWFRPILEIDYFVTVGLASSDLDKNQSARKLKQVPVCFQSPDDYVEIFRPLVLEEFKAQLHSSLMEMASLEEMSCGVLSVLSVERVDDFHVVRCVHDDSILDGSKSCMENDLVLLTRQHLKFFSNDVHMVGKVERHEKDNKRKSSILVIKFYLQNGCSRLNRAKKLLMERSKWHIHRIMSITPQLREFQALSSIKSIPLLPVILNPSNQPSSLESRKDLSKLSQPLQQTLKSSFNESQLKAISSVIGSVDSRKDYDLSLVQGPPGTGKTRTIVAIVSALLSLSGLNTRGRPENGGQRSRNTSFIGKVQISQSAAIARAWQDAALAKQLSDDEGRSCKAMASHTRGRVLICAQSNAAVDELVSRISNTGLYGSDGLMYKPYLVRVGNAKTVHPSSLPFFIDTLVDHRLMEEKVNAGDGKNDVDGDSSTVLRSKLENLVDRIRFFEAKRANLSSGHPDSKQFLQGDAARGGDDVKDMSDAEIGAKLKKLYSDKKAVYIDLSAAQAREKKANEERKALRHKLRKSILREAEIVITTLSGCGGDLYAVCSESILTHKFSSSSEYSLFDAVVIDEAAQALEPATLIPLQLLKSKAGKCIMVGDPKQLTATVLSNIASKYLYQCSMFERLQKAGHPVTMLTKQYRMHPEICRFPALHFYHGKLLNGDQMSSKEAPFHKTEGLGPYLFFDILDGQERHGNNSGSLYNECEADAAVELLRFFKKSYPSEFVGGRIGVITPYRSQLSLLRSRFSTAFGSCIMDEMELNTVDGFQGREVDILVLSTVRATEISSAATKINNRSIGFVADVRRMNVALTRAKYSLWILGNVGTLQTNEDWGALVNDAKERNLVISVKKPYSSMISSLSKRNQVPESSFHVPRHMKPRTNTNKASKYAQQQENSNKSSAERKRGYPGAHRNRNVDEDEYTYSTKMDVNEANKKARKQYDSSANKDHGSIDVKNNINRISKGMKSAIAEDKVTHEESWDRKSGEKQRFNRHIDMNKPSERSPHQGEGSRISSSSQVEKSKDTICKRKQQREAIDALLPSALISSKRPESSSKSVPDKRVHPPVRSSGHAIRPSKSKKG